MCVHLLEYPTEKLSINMVHISDARTAGRTRGKSLKRMSRQTGRLRQRDESDDDYYFAMCPVKN